MDVIQRSSLARHTHLLPIHSSIIHACIQLPVPRPVFMECPQLLICSVFIHFPPEITGVHLIPQQKIGTLSRRVSTVGTVERLRGTDVPHICEDGTWLPLRLDKTNKQTNKKETSKHMKQDKTKQTTSKTKQNNQQQQKHTQKSRQNC